MTSFKLIFIAFALLQSQLAIKGRNLLASTNSVPIAKPCIQIVFCLNGYVFNTALCKCVPKPCIRTVFCVPQNYFDFTLCKCVPRCKFPFYFDLTTHTCKLIKIPVLPLPVIPKLPVPQLPEIPAPAA